jgi:hypothetical protein
LGSSSADRRDDHFGSRGWDWDSDLDLNDLTIVPKDPSNGHDDSPDLDSIFNPLLYFVPDSKFASERTVSLKTSSVMKVNLVTIGRVLGGYNAFDFDVSPNNWAPSYTIIRFDSPETSSEFANYATRVKITADKMFYDLVSRDVDRGIQFGDAGRIVWRRSQSCARVGRDEPCDRRKHIGGSCKVISPVNTVNHVVQMCNLEGSGLAAAC